MSPFSAANSGLTLALLQFVGPEAWIKGVFAKPLIFAGCEILNVLG